ncbi:MAG TPA: ATP-dependent Clp protease proteolytic subunit [Bdellovibrionales bacterium]|nr:ATP-dependent Clp protease proteolytic subunit [Bdellovibrionales bacterium]
MAEKEKEEKEDKGAEPRALLEEKELFKARTILISAPVDAKLAHVVNTKLLALERADSKEPVYIYINCPGGEIHSGFAIFDMIRFISPKVYTIVSGLAASMGSLLALAAPRERRYALPNAKFLIHQPSVYGGLGGSASDIEIHAKDLIDTKNHIIRIYSEETGQSEEKVRAALDRDYWMTASQALEWGLIAKVVKTRGEIK